MKRSFRILAAGLGIIAVLAIAAIYGLFHGYFDHGRFEIKQAQSASADRVAMLAERSDNEALGGLEYYVLIGNHLYTPAELRRAYYGDAIVFSTSADCLRLRWEGQNRLIIRCVGSAVDMNHINTQRQRAGSVVISYENIALK